MHKLGLRLPREYFCSMRHEESNIQRMCVSWFRMQYPKLAPLLFAVPNGGARSRITGAMLKAEGVVPGVADLLLLVPRYDAQYYGLCVEVKTAVGKQSPAQRVWQQAVEEQGYRYEIVRSVEEFISTIKRHLSL